VLPYSLEVSFSVEWLLYFMRIDDFVFIDHLWNHSSHLFPFLSPLLSALWSGSVNTESYGRFLVGMSKGVDILLDISNMATVSDPSWLGHFVVEESGTVTLTPLLHSEPLDDIGFESLS
jgi:hypothetical protein